MPVIAFVQATNLQEVEGKPGVQVNMTFRLEGQQKTLELEGVVSVTDQVQIGSIEKSVDELKLGDRLTRTLLYAGARACWSSLFVHHRAATGFQWQSLRGWLRADEQTVRSIEWEIEAAFTTKA